MLEELFRLGTLDGEGPELFGQVSAVLLGREGDLYVLDGQASEVRVFGPDGTFRRTLGRAGQGPGELNRPAGMALDSEGRLWIMNWGNARYTAFDASTGELHRETRRLASFAALPWPGRFDELDRLVDIGLGRNGDPVVLRTDTAFVPVDTLSLPKAAEEDQIMFRRDGMMVMSAMEPFAPRPAWAPRPHDGIVMGMGAEYRLHRVGFDGDTTMTVELLRDPARVSEAERDSAMAAWEEMAERTRGATPDRQPRVRETKPAHGALFVDDRDRIWVQASRAEAGPAWDIFGEDGRFLGQVSVPLPPGFPTPSVRNDRLALVTELDGVPTVVVYRIVGLDS
ncbi:MAG TPA: 6-bladed beta-propeller [Gemmatimonadota bacterium]|nr:6-bladed beta-propeller [Gemmatimonadota bacterium]